MATGASGAIRIEGATKVDNAGAAAASRLLAFPATLHTLSVFNTSGSTIFVQLFDAAAVPADTAVPLISFELLTVTGKQWTWPQGRQFATGIVVVSSSTGGTKTITGAVALIDTTYRPKN